MSCPLSWFSIHRALTAGDLNRARREWAQLYPLMDAIMSAPFIPAIKAALNAQGFPAGVPRKPIAALDPATAATISELAAALPQFSLHIRVEVTECLLSPSGAGSVLY